MNNNIKTTTKKLNSEKKGATQMNKQKKTLLLLLATALIYSIILIPQIKANEENLYCVTSDIAGSQQACFPVSEDQQDICTGLSGIIVNADDYEGNPCLPVCCCSINDYEEPYALAYCKEVQEGDMNNTMFWYEEGVSTCSQICEDEGAINYYNLTTQIKHDDDLVNTGQYTIIRKSNTQVINTATFTQGTFTQTNLASATYTITITATKTINNIQNTCTANTEIILTENKNIEINLTCEPDTEEPTDPTDPEICNPDWAYEYSEDNCGEILDVIDLNNCPNAQPPQNMMDNIGTEIPCYEIPEELTCGNYNLDIGEECDFNEQGTIMFQDNLNTCQDFGEYESGTLGCSNCIINTDFCSNCPQDASSCDETMCDDCEICQSEQVCTDSEICQENSVLTLNPITGIFQQTPIGLRLTWNAPQACLEDSSIKIYRATCPIGENNCNVPTNTDPLDSNLPTTPSNYKDTNFQANKDRTFCYKLKLTNTNLQNPLESNIACSKLPDIECIGKPNGYAFCSDNAIHTCIDGFLDEGNLCPENTFCINPTTTEPRCESQTICDACSGPFGMFGFQLYNDQDYIPQGENYNCEESETQQICFREDLSKRLTIHGQFNHCTTINSCYDYVTQGSCERNTCATGTNPEDGCVWESIDNNELGLGVCKPQNLTEQNCNLCDDNPSGYCSEELCALYGDCYYNPQPDKTNDAFAINKYYCNNIEEVGCETYHTQELCEGEPPQELIIDIIYSNTDDSVLNAISGTHEITQRSDDLYDKGLCVWIETENKCIRDADFKTNYGEIESDCSGNQKNNKDCLLDFTPPNTTILIQEEQLENNGVYSTRQLYSQGLIQILQSKQSRLFLSIKNKDLLNEEGKDYDYPNMTPNAFAYHILDNIDSIENNNEQYVLAYFSKDYSNNLEEVKIKTINLLTSLNIDVNHDLTSNYYSQIKMILSNITINVTNPIQDEFSCKGTLQSMGSGQIGIPVTKTTNNSLIQWNYSLLEDDTYKFIINCTDNYMQKTNKEYTFNISEDNILTNSSPKRQTFNTNTVNIQIDTKDIAQCSYLSETNMLSEGTFTDTELLENNRYRHKATIPTPQEGVYILRPTCIFEDKDIGVDGEYIGNNGDLISFAVDKQEPKLTIYDRSLGHPEDPIKYNSSLFPEQSLNLEFHCDDAQTILNYNNFDFYFGCKNMTYELTHSFIETLNRADQDQVIIVEEGTMQSGTSKTFTTPAEFAYVNLNINVSDKGGNYKIHNIPLRLRNLSYIPPLVVICDPQTQICT